jgi:hypothetical protein
MKAILVLLFSLVVLVGSASAAPNLSSENSEAPEKDFPYEKRMIFFSVLEGLYTSGVNSEDLKFILPNPTTMTDPEHPDQVNFIYACPICMPTFDALRLYHERQKFYGQKGTVFNTFGVGLDTEMKKALRGKTETRRQAIRTLIDQWVHAYLGRQSHTDKRRAEIDENLEEMRKEGSRILKTFQDSPDGFYGKIYAGWERCFACDGACSVK